MFVYPKPAFVIVIVVTIPAVTDAIPTAVVPTPTPTLGGFAIVTDGVSI